MGKDLLAARKTFDRAWRLWRQGEDPAGLLSEAYLRAMERGCAPERLGC